MSIARRIWSRQGLPPPRTGTATLGTAEPRLPSATSLAPNLWSEASSLAASWKAASLHFSPPYPPSRAGRKEVFWGGYLEDKRLAFCHEIGSLISTQPFSAPAPGVLNVFSELRHRLSGNLMWYVSDLDNVFLLQTQLMDLFLNHREISHYLQRMQWFMSLTDKTERKCQKTPTTSWLLLSAFVWQPPYFIISVKRKFHALMQRNLLTKTKERTETTGFVSLCKTEGHENLSQSSTVLHKWLYSTGV